MRAWIYAESTCLQLTMRAARNRAVLLWAEVEVAEGADAHRSAWGQLVCS